jgi:hypothetical protein
LDRLTRDPLAVTGSAFYIGLLSNLGVMLWSATTAICFFRSFLLGYNHYFRPTTIFLFMSGMLCLILSLDDAFMLHEEVFPDYFGLSEKSVLGGYLIIFAGYLVYFFRQIARTEYLLFILALIFLGLSAILDQILPMSNLQTFIEDSLKFAGIVYWLTYFSRTVFVAAVQNRL